MRRGFSLIELLIAVSLAVVVMLAIVSVSTNMVRQHLQASHKGEVNGQTLAALDRMNKDIEGASYLFIPTTATPTGDTVGGCYNWEAKFQGSATGGPLTNGPITYFLYCVDATRFGNIYRWTGTVASCSPAPTYTACTAAGTANGGTNAAELWIAGDGATHGISRSDALSGVGGYYFMKSRVTNGVEVHYIVGNSTPTADGAGRPGQYVPHFYKVDTRINMLKSFNNTSD
ncbi:MAG: prepilin-type N-terminal cleavage/methylation domain-containing protein [Elusimicrobia bacterium]|nr:prepilin-type N-terminal cleavage/methylation domain-containing protein [Elusimicrobiota bacterium]